MLSIIEDVFCCCFLFFKEFEDIENLNLTGCVDDKVTSAVPSATTSDSILLTDDDMNTIHTLHTSLFTSLTVSNWYLGNLGQLPKLNLVQPVLLKYRVLSDTVRSWRNLLGNIALTYAGLSCLSLQLFR